MASFGFQGIVILLTVVVNLGSSTTKPPAGTYPTPENGSENKGVKKMGRKQPNPPPPCSREDRPNPPPCPPNRLSKNLLYTQCVVCFTQYPEQRTEQCKVCCGKTYMYVYQNEKQIDWKKVKEKSEEKTGDFSRIIAAIKEYHRQVSE